jgi:hypothetical protein
MSEQIPEADAAEQAAPVAEDEEMEEGTEWPSEPPELPYDADEADVAEQIRVVAQDEDDYR